MSEHRIIAGFELKERLGTGGDGSVYKAVQLSLGRDVAIKLLTHGSLRDAEDVERFRNEAQIAARLKHPGIVQVYECGEDKGEYFIAMEYIAGENMLDRIHRKGTFREKTVIAVGSSVADALMYAWEKAQLIHCDVKPDNILVDEDGSVKVVDLGIATMLGLNEVGADSEMFRCTPHYVAPEIVRGNPPPDFRADIYSLGATMYHMLTGEMPFKGVEDSEVLTKQMHGVLPDPRKHNAAVSVGMSQVLRRMMARDPAQRYDSWRSLLEDFNRLDSGVGPLQVLASSVDSTIEFMEAPAAAPVQSKRKVVVPHGPSSPHDAHMAAKTYPKGKSSSGLIFVIILIAVGVGLFVLNDTKEKQGQTPPPVSPGPVVTPPPPVPPPPPPSEAEKAAQALFDQVDAFATANPQSFREVIRRYEALIPKTEGTSIPQKARRAIENTEVRRKAAMNLEMARLGELSVPLIARGDYGAAIRLYDDYTGPLADDLRTLLRDEARRLRRARDDAAKTTTTTPPPTDVTQKTPPPTANPPPDLRVLAPELVERLAGLAKTKNDLDVLRDRLRGDVLGSYIALLEKGAERLQAQGNLEGTLAFRKEKERAEREAALPKIEELAGPSVLLDLANKAVGADYKILEEHRRNLKQTVEKMQEMFNTTIADMTRSGDIEKAVALRKVLRDLENAVQGLDF